MLQLNLYQLLTMRYQFLMYLPVKENLLQMITLLAIMYEVSMT